MKILPIILIASIAFSCDNEDDIAPTDMNNMVMDMTPANANENGIGTFTGYAHSLSGKALLLVDDVGKKVIRFEDFSMTAGPDVYVFVSKSNNYSKANAIEIAQLTGGYTESDINFTFDSADYTSDYKFVLVYCVQYNSLFGFAELK